MEYQLKDISRILPHLAAGASGVVYKGYVKNRNELVAIKDMPVTGPHLFEEWRNEVEFMHQNPHPYIVSVYGFCADGKSLTIIMEYMPEGSLYEFLHEYDSDSDLDDDINDRHGDRQPSPHREDDLRSAAHEDAQGSRALSFLDRLQFARQVTSAMSYLHEHMVMHRDIKSLNFLVNKKRVCKLTDFGTAKLAHATNKHHTERRGTPLWMAPEVRDGLNYGLSADIFSLGIVLFEIFTSNLPEYNERTEDVELPTDDYLVPLLPVLTFSVRRVLAS